MDSTACSSGKRADGPPAFCTCARSGRRRESEGSGLTPSQLLSFSAKWVKPYASPSGLGAHCAGQRGAARGVRAAQLGRGLRCRRRSCCRHQAGVGTAGGGPGHAVALLGGGAHPPQLQRFSIGQRVALLIALDSSEVLVPLACRVCGGAVTQPQHLPQGQQQGVPADGATPPSSPAPPRQTLPARPRQQPHPLAHTPACRPPS